MRLIAILERIDGATIINNAATLDLAMPVCKERSRRGANIFAS